MAPDQFEALAQQGYNRIPLCREVASDLYTPLAIYLKLAADTHSFLFESVQGGERWGRFSIIGMPSEEHIEIRGRQLIHRRGSTTIHRSDDCDPLAWLDEFRQRFRVAPMCSGHGLRFHGGLVGYFGYDTVRLIEPKLGACKKPDPLGAPDALLMVCETLAVMDNLRGTLTLMTHADPMQPHAYQDAIKRLDALEDRLMHPTALHGAEQNPANGGGFVSGFTESGFKAAVNSALRYIGDGDIMQVVLSQRLSAPFTAAPIEFYRALRRINPSPYLYFLDLGERQIVGSSPEILVRLQDGEVTVRPIAGTRRRGRSEAEDLALEQELLADPKEIAEHLMLIDLGRNDVGRVSETGSVQVTEKMCIERYSHVMHMTSNVTGRLKPGLGPMDVLKATFPAGTVSGAPKIRAMEIIDELEPVKRGIYSGAVGYIGWDGNMDTAIAIRTAVIQQQQMHVQAGAGIVYDSRPELEWKETMNKAGALLQAAAVAQGQA